MKKQKISRWEKKVFENLSKNLDLGRDLEKWRKETEKYKFSALLEEYNIRELEI